jgi:hypothetical protein
MWGPRLWRVLFAWAMRSPKPACRLLLNKVSELCPCRLCRVSAREYVKNTPCCGANPPIVFLWSLHNSVNKKLGKPSYTLAEAVQRHTSEARAPSMRNYIHTLAYLISDPVRKKSMRYRRLLSGFVLHSSRDLFPKCVGIFGELAAGLLRRGLTTGQLLECLDNIAASTRTHMGNESCSVVSSRAVVALRAHSQRV